MAKISSEERKLKIVLSTRREKEFPMSPLRIIAKYHLNAIRHGQIMSRVLQAGLTGLAAIILLSTALLQPAAARILCQASAAHRPRNHWEEKSAHQF